MHLDMPTEIWPHNHQTARNAPVVKIPTCTFKVVANVTLTCFEVVYDDLWLMATVERVRIQILAPYLVRDKNLLFACAPAMILLCPGGNGL